MLFVERERLAPGRPLVPPHFFPIHCPAAHFSARIGEPNILPVSDRRRRCGITVTVCHGTLRHSFQIHRPKQFPGFTINGMAADLCAESFLALSEGGKEQPIFGNRNAALPAIWKRGFPKNILVPRHAPRRHRRFACGLPVTLRTTGLWPFRHAR